MFNRFHPIFAREPRSAAPWMIAFLTVVAFLAVALTGPQVATAAVVQPAFPHLATWWPNASAQTDTALARADWIALQNYDSGRIAGLRAVNPSIVILGYTDARELNYIIGDYNNAANVTLRSASTDWVLTQIGSTLTSPISASTTSIPVADVTKFVVGDMVLVDNEYLHVDAVGASSLTVSARPTVSPATTHAAGARIAALVTTWPGTVTFDLSSNCPKRDVGHGLETWSDWNVRRGVSVLNTASWDGLLIDCLESNASWMVAPGKSRSIDPLRTNIPVTDNYAAFNTAWNTGAIAYGNNLKAASGNKMLIGNGNIRNFSMNGNIFEEFPYAGIASNVWDIVIPGPYTAPHASYAEWCANAASPNLTLLQVYGTATNYQLVRFGLTTALMNNGYFSYAPSSSEHAWNSLSWYDEYDNAGAGHGYLGQPTGAAVQVGNAWRRDYDNGVALVNPSDAAVTIQLGATFRKIKGTQAPTVNDGSLVTAVTLQAKDGIVLLRVAPVATYTLTYAAGSGGTITGTSPQTVNSGASGTAVTAVANSGYHFVNWSDGVSSATRTDTNVTANKSVTANFTLSSTTTLTAPERAKLRKTLRVSGTVSVAVAGTTFASVAATSTLTVSAVASTPATPVVPTRVRIVKSRLIRGKWRVTGTFTVAVVHGKFSYTFKPAHRSTYRFVATALAGTTGVSRSRIKTVKVR